MSEAFHHRFMREAIELSKVNIREGRGGPFAALIVKDGTVLARGTNLVTSTNDPTAHAEIVVIREACRALGSFQLEGCDMYTSCEPCPCASVQSTGHGHELCTTQTPGMMLLKLDSTTGSSTMNSRADIGCAGSPLPNSFGMRRLWRFMSG